MNQAAAPRAKLTAIGLAGGGFAGLTGVGGGAIMIPLLTGLLGMRQHTAHGTSLLIIIFAAAAGALTYALDDGIDGALVLILLAGSLAGAYAGARFVQRVDPIRLHQAFAIFLLCVALRLLLFHDVEPLLSVEGAAERLVGAGIGLAGGFAAGTLGVGGGAVFVPGLVILLGTGQHQAQGVSLAVIVVTAAVAAATHYRHGSMDTRAALWIVPSSVPAGALGALAATRLDGDQLQRIFAVVVLGVGLHLLVSATLAQRRRGRAARVAVLEAPPV